MLVLHFVVHVSWWHISPHEQSLLAVQRCMQYPVSKLHGHVPSHFKIDFEHPINGFPLYPVMQLHWTPWLITLHSAHGPQVVALSHGANGFENFQRLQTVLHIIIKCFIVPLHCLSIHASLSGHCVSLWQPPIHKRFSHIWLGLHLVSELHTALQIPLWHRSSDKHCKSLWI